MSKIIKKRRPWNRVSEQIYSISTVDSADAVNMNIATYVVPVTMDVKRYVLAVYANTKTHENIFTHKNNPFIILQGLKKEQVKLVQVLGKKSGLRYDKQKYLEKYIALQYCTVGAHSLAYVRENAFSLLLEIEQYIELSDHDLIICRVEKVLQNNTGAELLTTVDLQDAKIIG